MKFISTLKQLAMSFNDGYNKKNPNNSGPIMTQYFQYVYVNIR